MNTSEPRTPDPASRPFGYWLKAADRLMAAEFAAAFEAEGASRRDWRLLNLVDGAVPVDRPLPRHKLQPLADRGWVVADGDGWTLTDAGREAKERLGALVDGIRAKVTDAVSPEDLETTIASLQSIARAFGWDEQTPLPRGRGRHRGDRFGHDGHGERGGRFDWRRLARLAHLDAAAFGHGDGPDHGFDRGPRGFGPGRGYGPGRGFGPDADSDHGYRDGHPHHPHGREGHGHHGDDDGCGHGGHRHHEHHGHEHGDQHGHALHGRRHPLGGHGPHPARLAQHAYERGFDAGFSRGREA